MLDIHSHILPQFDDGASSVEESVIILESLKAQGCTHVLLTPHFYAQTTDIEIFSEMFLQKFSLLQEAVKDKDLPVLLPGCEVFYFDGISTCADLNELTLNHSKHILLELPQDINPKVLDSIVDLSLNRGIVPIIAHVERYKKSRYYGNLLEFVGNGIALSHINASSFNSGVGSRDCLSLIENNLVTFVASDAHNTKNRAVCFDKAFKKINKKFGENFSSTFINNSIALLKQIGIDSIE